MSTKMKLSEAASRNLDEMANVLGLRRNVVCRIALGVSLGIEEPPAMDKSDNNGIEFNKPTILGTDEPVLTALVSQHFGARIDPEEFFSRYVRAEITRGLEVMVRDYRTINSPVEYFERLSGLKGEINET